jgi:hypothetical protein
MAQDRILAQDVSISMIAEQGSLGADIHLMTEIDKFDGEWVPDILKTWPGGSKNYHYQLAGGYYKVSIDGGQMGGGFLSLGSKQHQAIQMGLPVPKVRLTRTATTKSGQTFRETYTGGIVTDAKNSQAAGNAALTTSVAIEFENMS